MQVVSGRALRVQVCGRVQMAIACNFRSYAGRPMRGRNRRSRRLLVTTNKLEMLMAAKLDGVAETREDELRLVRRARGTGGEQSSTEGE